jgi:hypothetical protein
MFGSAHAAAARGAHDNHAPDLPRLRRHPRARQPTVAHARAVATAKRGVTPTRSAHTLAMSDLRLSPVSQGSAPALASAQQEEHLAALIRLEGTEIELSFTIVAQQL